MLKKDTKFEIKKRKMEDKYLNEVFDEFQLPTIKKFSEVFLLQQTKIGNQIVTITSIKVGDKQLDPGITIINSDLLIDNVSIFDLQDKQLIGTTSFDKKVFNITGFKDKL